MTLEGLQEIFFEEAKPYWRIYSGQGVRGPKRSENVTVSEMEESADLLLSRLNMLGEGVYTVVLLNDPNTNNSRGTHHPVKIDSMGGMVATGGNAGQPAGGIMGMNNFMQMLEFAKMVNNQGSEHISGAIEAAVEDVRKDFEIQRLKDRVKELEAGGAREKIIEAGIRKLPEILDRIFPGQQRAVAGVLGTSGIQDAGDAEAEESADGLTLSIDDAVNACLSIQESLPGQNVNQLLWKLANYIKANPDQAKGLLNML